MPSLIGTSNKPSAYLSGSQNQAAGFTGGISPAGTLCAIFWLNNSVDFTPYETNFAEDLSLCTMRRCIRVPGNTARTASGEQVSPSMQAAKVSAIIP
jgi:hypothetical protein